MLGARARLGRMLDTADEAAGSNVVVISTGAWQRYFQGDPGILGRTITLKTLGPEAGFLDGTPLTIVGVMPASFDFPIPNADYWAPITEGSPARKRSGRRHRAACRRARPSTRRPTRPTRSARDCGRSPRRDRCRGRCLPGVRRFAVEGVKEQIVAASRPALRVIAIAVGAVLLIVCANVASLLLARGTARQREVAVRLAVGASRGRILRQFITESLVLAAIGGVLGAVLAVGFVYLLREFASPHAQGVFQLSFGGSMLPRLHEIGVDGRLLGLAMGLAVITALLVGAMPAFRMSRIDHAQVMNYRGAGGQGGARRGDTRARSVLVVAQMVVATMLLVGAGLLINSFTRLARVDPGWNASGLLMFYLVMPQDYSTARKAALIDTLLTELRRQPDVRGVGYTYAGPLLGIVDTLRRRSCRRGARRRRCATTRTTRSSARSVTTTCRRWARGWWPAAGSSRATMPAAPPVIIVNRTVVRRLFNNENPVGRLVHLDGRMESPAAADHRRRRRHAAVAAGRGTDAADVRRLSAGAGADAGAQDADGRAGAPGIRIPVVLRAHRSRSGHADAGRAIARQPRRFRGGHRRDAADGAAGRVVAHAAAFLRDPARALCRDRRRARRDRHLRRARLCGGPTHAGDRHSDGARRRAIRNC